MVHSASGGRLTMMGADEPGMAAAAMPPHLSGYSQHNLTLGLPRYLLEYSESGERA